VRAKPLPAETRRAVTVEAVIELAAERDPGEITTAAIASHMKLTQGALFRHFPSKDAIWEAVMEWVAERLLARVDRAAAQAASPVAALQAIFLAHADFVAEHPGVPRMLFGELQRAGATPAKRLARTLLERYGERIRARLEAGKAAGEVSAALDVDAAVTLFVGTLQGLIMQSMLAGDILRIRQDAPRVFAIYLAGIRSAT
jgi:AcrR family transcriptional regulator